MRYHTVSMDVFNSKIHASEEKILHEEEKKGFYISSEGVNQIHLDVVKTYFENQFKSGYKFISIVSNCLLFEIIPPPY